MPDRPRTGLILSGGLALGAYQAGAFEVFDRADQCALAAVAGASIGAINGAIIAGNPPPRRVAQLNAFWDELATDRRVMNWFDPWEMLGTGSLRHLHNWFNVTAARWGGNPALYRPRLPFERGTQGIASLYDTDRTRATLMRFIDFDLLNDNAAVRFCCTATDIQTGACVVFDTAAGDRITPEHLLASGSLLPAFDPVQMDGRLLGDGGFAANAPLEPLLASNRIGPPLDSCFLLDLFPPDGPVPYSLERAAERAADLKYGCQTQMRLEGIVRERALEARLSGATASPTDIVYLSYRAPEEEAGPEKPYDFSARTLADRRSAGSADMMAALHLHATRPPLESGVRVHPVRRA